MGATNFSESVRLAIHIAQSLAAEYRHATYAPAHLLKGLMHADVGLRPFLRDLGKDDAYIADWAEVRIEELTTSGSALSPEDIPAEIAVINAFDEADNVRIKLGLDLITPVALLTALVKPGIAFDPNQLKSFPLKEREIFDLYLQEEKLTKATTSASALDKQGNAPTNNTSALQRYTTDRLQLVRDGKSDPIVARDSEVRMMMEILCRRTKPNVIIIGEAGVGKTAIVDGFAHQLVQGDVPNLLKGVQLLELDMGSLIAGASYKGEIEDRLKQIIAAIKSFDKAVLFIDEIHTLLDPKGPIGSGAANLLKPELARGEITVIGATTLDEYRKIIEPEQAFNRRFEPLSVQEPSEASAIKMLTKLAERYEAHHELNIDKDAIPACVTLAKRYIKDRRLPDSAFDLLDRTMASLKMMNDTSSAILTASQQQLDEITSAEDMAEADRFVAYRTIYEELNGKLSPILLGRITDERQVENFETADDFKSYLQANVPLLTELAEQHVEQVTKDDVVSVVAYKTGIPMGKLQTGEKEKLQNLEAHLKKRVIGQDQAVKAVSDAILESRSGLNKKGQPIGSFFFLGPTGTGKTELAKSIAAFLFNDEKAMIRFDMSEFKEEHSAALLYGAPPGYVGYEEGGLLVNKIRQQPYAVLLFDEIEKAHPSVFDTFLQILDEGHMHDRLGKQGDFSNALILFTSNIGSEWIAERIQHNEMPTHNQLMDVMAGNFRPEFLARISEIVPFAPISTDSVVHIFDIQLQQLIALLEKQGITFEMSAEAKEMIAMRGFTPKYGARQLAAGIRNELRRPISKMIINGTLSRGNHLSVTKVDDSEELAWDISNQDELITEFTG